MATKADRLLRRAGRRGFSPARVYREQFADNPRRERISIGLWGGPFLRDLSRELRKLRR